MRSINTNKKRVYAFGENFADGSGNMKDLLGGKGANLAEMCKLGIPVPPGFTITTETCQDYNVLGKKKTIELLREEVKVSLLAITSKLGNEFGSNHNPCLFSVRSGSRASMPGMMDTVLNLGLNDQAVEGLIKQTANPNFVLDSYRRFIQMYGNVVLGVKEQLQLEHDPFEEVMEAIKAKNGIINDSDLLPNDYLVIINKFKEICKNATGIDFPQDPWEQLWNTITAVFDSWMNPRAIYYRKLNNIPESWGTAVNVQAMVFGNMGKDSATGVAFTRDSSTGEPVLNGEYLLNAQGEDVVAGVRTPLQITKKGSLLWAQRASVSEQLRLVNFPSLEESMPCIYKQFHEIQAILEDHYLDMQDIEFTIQQGKLWILQTRNGKRTAAAMLKIAVDLLNENKVNEHEALLMIDPMKIEELMHPVFHPLIIVSAKEITTGLPASPGAATGQIVFFSEDAEKFEQTILIRIETSPEDLEGMHKAQGILTCRGGMTSHAAVVARGMGKCCISAADNLRVNYESKSLNIGDKIYKEGDWISLNGNTGVVYEGKLQTTEPVMNRNFNEILKLANKHKKLKVYTNAETIVDCQNALKYGAEGIGLCRTEHMFFEETRILEMRKMILATDEISRKKALNNILPLHKEDIKNVLKFMQGKPVTIRLLDPPLHEFLPHETESKVNIANELDCTVEEIEAKITNLNEVNPMLGHRGCRLGITFPEITKMQTRAIIEATIELQEQGVIALPEIMIPLIGTVNEFKIQKQIITNTIENILIDKRMHIQCNIGTMIEVPRACLIANQIAVEADFFSFGTNDLTQMTFGYSRDDISKFLPDYLSKNILKNDPFQVLDQEGVGLLIQKAVSEGRAEKPELKIGVCGEHGGDPLSINFFSEVGLNYISCSPFRVPVAIIVAAQAAVKAIIKEEKTQQKNKKYELYSNF